MENTALEKRLKEIEESAGIRAAREAAEREVIKKRKAAAKEIDKLKTEGEKRIFKLNDDLEKATQTMNSAADALRDAEKEVNRLRLKKWGESARLNNAINKWQEIIYTTYDPEIDRGIEFFNTKLADFRRLKANSQTRNMGLNLIKLKKKLVTYSNKNSILRAVEYCQQSIKLLEAMKLEPEFDEVLLEKLKDNIPDPHQLEDFNIEKSDRDVSDINPFHLLPTDEDLASRVARIDAKLAKL